MTTRRPYLFLRSAWIVLFCILPLIPIFLFLHGAWDTFFHMWTLAMVLGLVSYTFFCSLFVMSSHPHLLTRAFDLSKIYAFHGQVATWALVFSLAHGVLRVFSPIFSWTPQVILGIIALGIFLFVAYIGIRFLAKKIKGLTRKYSYESKLRMHALSSLGLLFLLFHVLGAYSTKEAPIRSGFLIAYFLVAFLSFAHIFVFRPLLLRRHPFLVSGVTQFSEDLLRIRLRALSRTLPALAGQFAYFTFLSSSLTSERHPFTLSSYEEQGKNCELTLRICGDYTEKLSLLKKGDKVLVDGPYGHFTVDYIQQPICLIAGGVGITPFLSILKMCSKRRVNQKISLLFSAKREEDFSLLNAVPLEKINGVTKTFFLTGSEAKSKEYHHRRIDIGDIEKSCEIDKTVFFLCGPVGMMTSLRSKLLKKGVASRNIRQEKFTAS